MARTKSYPSDLNDVEWDLLAPLLDPPRSGRGRKPTIARREVADAIFYVLRTGCQWRYLPEGFPHWNTVYGYWWTTDLRLG